MGKEYSQNKCLNRSAIFTAAFIIIFICCNTTAFSVFVNPLGEATSATPAQVSLTLTFDSLFFALSCMISGKIVDKFGPKMLVYAGGFLYGASWVLTGFVNSLPMLYLTFGLLAGFGGGLLYNPALNTALRWFPEKRGTMSGVLLCASSLGPIIIAKFGAILCEQLGSKCLIFIGIFNFIVVWLAGCKMEAPGKGWTSEGCSSQEVSGISFINNEYTPKEMVATGTFWIMFVLFAIASTAGVMMMGSLSVIAQIQLNITPMAAANIVVINSLSNFCGRLAFGRLCDRFGETKSLALALLITIIGLLGLKSAVNQGVFIIFLILLGASFGGVLVIFPPMTSKTFGIRNSGINYGLMFFGYSSGAIIAPMITSMAANPDLKANEYSQAYIIAAIIAGIGLLIDLYLIAKQKKKIKH